MKNEKLLSEKTFMTYLSETCAASGVTVQDKSDTTWRCYWLTPPKGFLWNKIGKWDLTSGHLRILIWPHRKERFVFGAKEYFDKYIAAGFLSIAEYGEDF